MIIDAHETVDWVEIHKITKVVEGRVFHTEYTGLHTENATELPEGFMGISISVTPDTRVMIEPWDKNIKTLIPE